MYTFRREGLIKCIVSGGFFFSLLFSRCSGSCHLFRLCYINEHTLRIPLRLHSFPTPPEWDAPSLGQISRTPFRTDLVECGTGSGVTSVACRAAVEDRVPCPLPLGGDVSVC